MSQILLTDSAAKRISQQIAAKENAIALRFIVKQSGCSGYSYQMEIADAVQDGETLFESNGVQVISDDESLKLVAGTQIDYVQEGLNQTFKFSNPKADAHCGCGESFSV